MKNCTCACHFLQKKNKIENKHTDSKFIAYLFRTLRSYSTIKRSIRIVQMGRTTLAPNLLPIPLSLCLVLNGSPDSPDPVARPATPGNEFQGRIGSKKIRFIVRPPVLIF